MEASQLVIILMGQLVGAIGNTDVCKHDCSSSLCWEQSAMRALFKTENFGKQVENA
jgi:hypothetical protein